jgi:hypothetical protein
MPLNLYPNVQASGSVPENWKPVRGGTFKDPVRNRAAVLELRRLRPGRWRKVIKLGNIGEVHYFEHTSGNVADVKFFAWTETL